jgi:hypothetical protein
MAYRSPLASPDYRSALQVQEQPKQHVPEPCSTVAVPQADENDTEAGTTGEQISAVDETTLGADQPEGGKATKDRERKQNAKYFELFGCDHQPTVAWEILPDDLFACHVSKLIFSTAIQSMHHMGKAIYRQQLLDSMIPEDPNVIAEIEEMSLEEKEKLHSQKYAIIKHRNAAHQELRVEAARLAKTKRKLEHDLLVAKGKIHKMQVQHGRQMDYVKSTFQRKLDRLSKHLATRTTIDGLAGASDMQKDLEKYCFEPYDWAPSLGGNGNASGDEETGTEASRATLVEHDITTWLTPESLDAASDVFVDSERAFGEDNIRRGTTAPGMADFHAYCIEPYIALAHSPPDADGGWPLQEKPGKQRGESLQHKVSKECPADLRVDLSPAGGHAELLEEAKVDNSPRASAMSVSADILRANERFPKQRATPEGPRSGIVGNVSQEICAAMEDLQLGPLYEP